jgi:hypothetical protein
MAHGLVGAIAGGILVLSIGFLKHVIEAYLHAKIPPSDAPASAANVRERSPKSKKFMGAINWPDADAA